MKLSIKNKLRKLSVIGCSLLTLISLGTPIHAASHVASFTKTSYDVYHNFNVEDRFSGTTMPPGMMNIANFSINGQKAYCVEPHVQISTHPYYAHEQINGYAGFLQIGYTQAQVDEMAYISSIGYGYNGDTSEEMLAATQLRIWQVRFPNGFSSIPAPVQNKINEINSRLSVINNTVSFAESTIQLEGYGEQFAKTVTDTTNTFSQYLNSSLPNGLHVSRNGNSLTIWADKNASETGTMTFDALYHQSEATDTTIAYYNPSNQTLGVFEKQSPKKLNVYYEILVQPETDTVSASKKGKGNVDVDIQLLKQDKEN